ncbi:MAG: crotonase/enoyl-CoA hydratase family protein [Chrysiogenetes bacterium]|nr:crotonase/enoyl-CoA hydratase family protein [Chrysiogenetes bacterium]
MGDYKVILTEKDGHVGVLTLNRPDKLNAMGPDFWEEFPAAVRELDEDPEVRCIVIKAAGRAFTAGLDLVSMGGSLGGGGAGSEAARRRGLHKEVHRLQGSISATEKADTPVIVAVHGACIGGGIDLITACDIRLSTKDAKFSVRETKIAIVADVGTLQRLPRIIGRGHTSELALTGKDIDGEYAREIGLVNRTYESAEDLHAAALVMAREIAENSPLVTQGVKQVLRYGEYKSVDDALEYVAVWNSAFLMSNDFNEAIAAFMQKRKPVFKGE